MPRGGARRVRGRRLSPAASFPAQRPSQDTALALALAPTPPNPSTPRAFAAQSNSEHSRHWFFRGDIVLDGRKMPHNLMDIVKAPLEVGSVVF